MGYFPIFRRYFHVILLEIVQNISLKLVYCMYLNIHRSSYFHSKFICQFRFVKPKVILWGSSVFHYYLFNFCVVTQKNIGADLDQVMLILFMNLQYFLMCATCIV